MTLLPGALEVVVAQDVRTGAVHRQHRLRIAPAIPEPGHMAPKQRHLARVQRDPRTPPPSPASTAMRSSVTSSGCCTAAVAVYRTDDDGFAVKEGAVAIRETRYGDTAGRDPDAGACGSAGASTTPATSGGSTREAGERVPARQRRAIHTDDEVADVAARGEANGAAAPECGRELSAAVVTAE